ncbi:MAG: dTDP-4-dehydrorhamnose reductase [Syntrophus sp. (in: bacteria)]|nr:dTDP-4-dehydrorhamnose reductase [Syntrophus sp. (in: bacteria)]
MRILILGHRGMLGSELLGSLSVGHEVTGKDIDDFDIASEASCRRVIAEAEPDVVINAAAYTDVDGSEQARELCFAVNAVGVKNVALACRPAGIKIVHFSTDYVFDGLKEAPYREEDVCRPLNVYGEAKLAGEHYLRQYSGHYLLIRTAWLYGKQGKNFVKTIIARAKEFGRLEIVNDQKGSPTYARDLAAAVERLLTGRHSGIFHVTNRGSCSWYEFTLKILAFAGIGDVPVMPIISGQLKRPAARPLNSTLNCKRLTEATGKTMRFWQLALHEYMARERMTGGA